MGYKVALVGATGNVGREMLNILEERKFPADEVVALASRRSIGVEVSYGDRTLKVKALENYDFSDVDICLMSAGGSVSKEWSPRIGAAGCVVIDNSSAWRMDPDVPLVVPEVNAAAVAGFSKKNIIANPNCSTAQLVVALKPLHDKAVIKRVVVATYQSVSGAGKDAMDELFRQTRAVFVADPIELGKFTKQIAFNVIPPEKKDHLQYPPGTMPRFCAYFDTDYEFALNRVGEPYGGGAEIFCLQRPGMMRKHFFPRQPRAAVDGGPVKGDAKLVVKDNVVECAIPWSEIPEVKRRVDAGQTIKFSFRVNNGGSAFELAAGRSVSKDNCFAFHNDWSTHWANELEFGFEK